jgi:CubicO group peptidase (beta-lactamase class C family)
MVGRRMRSFAFALLAVTLMIPPTGTDAQIDSMKERVDSIFSEYDRSDSPGAALGVIKDGELIYARGYGMANLEYGLAITPRTVFRIGSTSKQFTAMCILLLEQEGRISIDADIRRHLPELPDYGPPITIRHLIHHTSGMRDYLTVMSLAGRRGDDFYTDEEVMDMLARQKELNFPTGAQHLYCNSGYFLLSQIVFRVTGKTMAEYAREEIFEPLGMKDTHFHDDHTMIVPNRASGYAPTRDGGYRISMTTLGMIGDGGVFTTVEDLLLWDRNFYTGQVGGMELIERMQVPGSLNDGTRLTYAFGLGVRQHRGLRLVAHGGAFVGFRADMARFPDQRLSVICLANRADANPSSLALEVASVYLEDSFTEPVPQPRERAARQRERPEPFQVAPAELAAYAGDYYSEELDATYNFRFEIDRLTVRVGRAFEGQLIPQERDVFRAQFMTLRFFRDDAGNITGYLLDAGRARNFRFTRAAR